MEIKTENTVAENVTFYTKMPIDNKRFKAEKDYRLSMRIISTMLSNGIISSEEYATIETNLRQKINPISSDIF